MNPILMIVVGAIGTTGIVWGLHLTRLKKHRGMSREDFTSHFISSGISPEIPGAVYDQFRKLGVWKGFMPGPTDTLEGTYKIVGEDVEYNLHDVLQALGFEMPHSGTLQGWTEPLETLSDVVRWVEWVRTKQKPSVSVQ